MIDDEESVPEDSLLSWARQQLAGDEAARQSVTRLVWEFLVFYVILFLGFIFLYAIWRSNSQLQRLKARAAAVVREQQSRKWEDPVDGAKMYF